MTKRLIELLQTHGQLSLRDLVQLSGTDTQSCVTVLDVLRATPLVKVLQRGDGGSDGGPERGAAGSKERGKGGSSSIVASSSRSLSDGGALWNMYFGAGSAPGAADEAVYVYREGAALGEGVALGAMGAERKLLRARVQRLRARVEVLAAAAARAQAANAASASAPESARRADQVKPVDVLRQPPRWISP